MHSGPSLEDYLQKGLYGPKETKPEERRRFLGTLRERIIVALYTEQLYEKTIYPEIEAQMKAYPQAHLLLNGAIRYHYLSPYIQIAEKHNIPFTIVKNKVSNTDIGLVLTLNHAIHKKEIFVKNNEKPSSRHKNRNLLRRVKRKIGRILKKHLIKRRSRSRRAGKMR